MQQEISIIKATLDAMRAFTPQQKKEALDILSGKAAPDLATDKDRAQSPLLTQAETARYLNCSRHTISRMVADEQLHPVTVRGCVRYRRDELDAIANSGTGPVNRSRRKRLN